MKTACYAAEEAFVLALAAEAEGDLARAARYLDWAVRLETTPLSA